MHLKKHDTHLNMDQAKMQNRLLLQLSSLRQYRREQGRVYYLESLKYSGLDLAC